MGRVELRMVRLARFTEQGKAGIHGIGTVWRIEVLDPKIVPVEAAGEGGNIRRRDPWR